MPSTAGRSAGSLGARPSVRRLVRRRLRRLDAGARAGNAALPFMVLAAGSPLAAAGTNIAISAAAAGAGGLAHARAGRGLARGRLDGAAFDRRGDRGRARRGRRLEALLYGLIAGVLVWSGIDSRFDRYPRAHASVCARRGSALALGIGVPAARSRIPILRMPALQFARRSRAAARARTSSSASCSAAQGSATYAANAGVERRWRRARRRDPRRLARGARDRQVARERAGRTRVVLILVGVTFAVQAVT